MEKTYSDGIVIEYTTLSECRVMFDYGIFISPLEGLQQYVEFLSRHGDGSISIDFSHINEGLIILRQNLAKNSCPMLSQVVRKVCAIIESNRI